MYKNRLGIFVFYDGEGIVDDYILFLLQELNKILTKLIIVINGKISTESLKKLKIFSSDIYIRENLGFDGGAYKDTLLDYLHADFAEYDELVLCNDTFYGPFSSFQGIFDTMSLFQYDFWGLSRHSGGGKVMGIGMDNVPHVQGYFIVVNHVLLSSADFLEISFTVYFEKKGYLWGDYATVRGWNTKPNECNYMSYADIMIKDFHFPILKKKAVGIHNFPMGQNAVEYIREKDIYDVKLIDKNQKRIKKMFDPKEIEVFYSMHKRVFVWGNGKVGKSVRAYLNYMGLHVDGIIDSLNFLTARISPVDGIIVAVSQGWFREVLPALDENYTKEQLLLPCF